MQGGRCHPDVWEYSSGGFLVKVTVQPVGARILGTVLGSICMEDCLL